jgi:hypothetical protein
MKFKCLETEVSYQRVGCLCVCPCVYVCVRSNARRREGQNDCALTPSSIDRTLSVLSIFLFFFQLWLTFVFFIKNYASIYNFTYFPIAGPSPSFLLSCENKTKFLLFFFFLERKKKDEIIIASEIDLASMCEVHLRMGDTFFFVECEMDLGNGRTHNHSNNRKDDVEISSKMSLSFILSLLLLVPMFTASNML